MVLNALCPFAHIRTITLYYFNLNVCNCLECRLHFALVWHALLFASSYFRNKEKHIALERCKIMRFGVRLFLFSEWSECVIARWLLIFAPVLIRGWLRCELARRLWIRPLSFS